MKGTNENKISQLERDNALLNFVSKQAQEAILDPNLPNLYKDEILEAAIGTIQKVAERRAAYYAKYGEGRRTRPTHIIYEAGKNDEEERENIPPIIVKLNENLGTNATEDSNVFNVEWIAEKVGINKKILYQWVESDAEFTTALERLKDVQENDPFRTGTEEDTFVNSMTVALLLMETKDRHYKSGNS